ncbi:flagellar hook assembly protein FlgD [Geoalkalibacter halelectricus]|uniref:Basal-body rod modification protein FlgD n=1 Tax=Geoalkalibacter halelectricus TaxID=2847045 RepID=A0ABY5ZI35_9BACT|nr:flagellar hook assembly protein FlgD [Geoalkalibacter halelectricus]MDO3378074.1 flagellar hook assembly protein FlgD [Geoalkalibacter halelectricus]UWZ78371.1 flagellar hook assembly protein FlgD [Geoalkalibacter halelectricus]
MTVIADTQAVASGSLTKSLAGGSVMGKDDFLLLLVTQLQNQDPMNPQDPTEFTAQLAQFSSLEQLFAINDNLGLMAGSSMEMERLSALSMIGKEAVSGNGAFAFNGTSATLGYKLDSTAHEVSLHILDATGRNVANLPAAATSAGEHFLTWNGVGLNGQKVAPGEYQVVVRALDAAEETMPAKPLVKSVITGVDMLGGTNWLVSDNGNFRLKDIVSVRDL